MKVFMIFLILTIVSIVTSCGDKDKTEKVSAPNVGIHQAILMGDIEAVQQNIDAGTDVNEDEWTYGSSPLITSAVFGEFEIAKLLIKSGADLNFKNDEGSTALISAVAFKNKDIAQLLISSGANVDVVNNDGSSALIIATLYGNIDIVKSLLEKGANKHIENKYGRSAVSIVEAPFEETEELLKKLAEGLKIQFEYDRIKNNRPVIAKMLK